MSTSAAIHPAVGPDTFYGELRRFERRLQRYNLRWHLATFPRDLVRAWWKSGRRMPWPTSNAAYEAFKAGRPPSRCLFSGPSHFPQLRVIDGGA
jgi:hypothetical protein